jgi:hypothetical protein
LIICDTLFRQLFKNQDLEISQNCDLENVLGNLTNCNFENDVSLPVQPSVFEWQAWRLDQFHETFGSWNKVLEAKYFILWYHLERIEISGRTLPIYPPCYIFTSSTKSMITQTKAGAQSHTVFFLFWLNTIAKTRTFFIVQSRTFFKPKG